MVPGIDMEDVQSKLEESDVTEVSDQSDETDVVIYPAVVEPYCAISMFYCRFLKGPPIKSIVLYSSVRS